MCIAEARRGQNQYFISIAAHKTNENLCNIVSNFIFLEKKREDAIRFVWKLKG